MVVVKPADDGSYFVDTVTKKGQLVKFAPACQPYPGLELRIDPRVTCSLLLHGTTVVVVVMR